MFKLRIAALLALLFVIGAALPLQGQGGVTLTLAAPAWMSDLFKPELFDAFEAQHPGVQVVYVPDDADYWASPTEDIEAALDKWAEYAGVADVVFMPSYLMNPYATRAGYWLDLAPLMATDPNFNADDFFPSVLESFAWDGGQWALPVAGSVQIFVYDKLKFDAAGVPYPNESWTFEDLKNAARALTTYQPDGDVETPGFGGYNTTALFAAFAGVRFNDSTSAQLMPNFDDPAFVPFLEDWLAFEEEIRTEGQYDFQEVPLSIQQPWQLVGGFSPDDGEHEWAGALLPNITALVDAQGFAVSRGTLHPELAFALANYMTTNPEVINRMFGNSPARRSLVGVEAEGNTWFAREAPSPEVQALFDQAIANGMPYSEAIFQDYIWKVMQYIDQDGMDALSALQKAELDAVEALETASARRDAIVIAVATPVPTPVVGEGQILLRFGLNLFTSDVPDDFEQLKRDFIAASPNVGSVDLISQFFDTETFQQMDCFYQPNAFLESNPDISDILPLDPFLDADPNFDRADVLPGVLEALSRDGRTYGYPIVIAPSVLWYDSAKFEQAGVPAPELNDWNIDAFIDALNRLKATLEDEDDVVFRSETFGNNYLLMLIAAYGAVPYDVRTDPPTVSLTDPASVDAIRQVLDLAKNGLMEYRELVTNSGGFGGGFDVPMVDDTLTSFSWRLQSRIDANAGRDSYRLTNFPVGSQYTPVAYSVGAAYIRATAQDPQACYDLISSLARRPDLFGGIPARRTLLNDPSLAVAQGDDITALYQNFADRLAQPNVLILPGPFGGRGSSPGVWIEDMFMNRAFDKYVLEGADLETELAAAQSNIETYRQCTAPIPAPDWDVLGDDPDTTRAFMRQFTDCALALDPALRSQFGWYYQEGD